MTGREEQLLIAFNSTELLRQDLSRLWGMVVDAAAEQLADEISIEGPAVGPDMPAEVEEAQQRLLAGARVERRPRRWFERRWQWRQINQDAFDQIKLVGPWVVGLNLYRSGSYVAGISDYGTSIDLTVPESKWRSLNATIQGEIGFLPPHDIEHVAIE